MLVAFLCAAALVETAAAQVILSAGTGDPVAGDPVVAVFDGGVVKASDLDREARFLSPGEKRFREEQGLDEPDARRDFARRAALRVIARRLAQAEGRAAPSGGIGREYTADPEPAEAAREAGRRWYLARWREGCYGLPFEIPEDAALATELGPQRTLPPRLRLSHVFLRATTADEVAAATARLAAWRAEIGSLEQFQDHAARFSDSQSAHRRGRLGTVRPGWLPAEAEAVLYELAEGAMSEPLALRGGVHLFWVEKRIPAATVPLDRRLAKLRAEKAEAARDACRAQRLAAAPPLPGGEEDEILYRSGVALGALTAEERLRQRDLEDDVWLRDLVARRMEPLLAEPAPEELRRRYDAEPGRFRSVRELAGRYLVARPPAGGDPIAFLDALTDLAARLDRGEADWSQAKRFGRTESFDLRPALKVAALLGPLVFDHVKALGPGEVSEPIQDGADFWVVAIDQEAPPRPLGFEEALPRLRREVLQEQEPQVKARVIGELLEGAGFRFVESE